MAKIAHLTIRTVERRFKRACHITLLQAKMKDKLHGIEELLGRNLPGKEIFKKAGYAQFSSLSRFVKTHGQRSLWALRKRLQKALSQKAKSLSSTPTKKNGKLPL